MPICPIVPPPPGVGDPPAAQGGAGQAGDQGLPGRRHTQPTFPFIKALLRNSI